MTTTAKQEKLEALLSHPNLAIRLNASKLLEKQNQQESQASNCSESDSSDDNSTDSSTGSEPNWEEQRSFRNLEIEFQGFDISDPTPEDDDDLDGDDLGQGGKEDFQQGIEPEWEPDSMEHDGKTFHKHSCYRSKDGKDVILGIKSFVSDTEAMCCVVIPCRDTVLSAMKDLLPSKNGREELPFPYVKLDEQHDRVVQLRHLSRTFGKFDSIAWPEYVYEKRASGSSMNFAYRNDTPKIRVGKRDKIQAIDLFCGAGGGSAGMAKNDIHTTVGVDLNKTACRSFLFNHKGFRKTDSTDSSTTALSEDEYLEKLKSDAGFLHWHLEVEGSAGVFHGGVDAFLQKCNDDPNYRKALGAVHHVHLSPPCQGFSSENRTGTEEQKRQNNVHSMSILLVADILQPLTMSFENVRGIWTAAKGYIQEYLYPIYMGLLKKGYSFRQFVAKACDYGDPQIRPRFFIMAARHCVSLPKVPPKTHGGGDGCEPYRTAREALRKYEGKFPQADVPMAIDGKYFCKGNEPSPAPRASKTPKHYSENRKLVWEEVHALTFDPTHHLEGNEKDKVRQCGNAIPIELASAISREIRSVLLYEYQGEELIGDLKFDWNNKVWVVD